MEFYYWLVSRIIKGISHNNIIKNRGYKLKEYDYFR
jgi:hypothetical protein